MWLEGSESQKLPEEGWHGGMGEGSGGGAKVTELEQEEDASPGKGNNVDRPRCQENSHSRKSCEGIGVRGSREWRKLPFSHRSGISASVKGETQEALCEGHRMMGAF